MKKLKNKNIILGLIAILVVMSVGFVVNSYYVERPKENTQNYSEALNKDFTGEVSIYNKTEFGIQAPGEQFWDGLDTPEKANRTLIVPKNKKIDGKIKYNEYEDFVIYKYGKDKQPLEGVKFCIAKPLTKEETQDKTEEELIEMLECDETYNSLTENWVTNKEGILKIPTNALPLYSQTIIETPDMQTTYKPIKLDIYVDPGNRFLGEVKGTDFIKYDELIATIDGEENPKEKIYKVGDSTNKIGKVLSKGNDSDTGGNWLKIYDAKVGKTLYIAKKPLTHAVSWNMLFDAGVVYGLDQIDINNIQADGVIKQEAPYIGKAGYKPKIIKIDGKSYIVRLLRSTFQIDPENTEITYDEPYQKEDLTKSEWNRFILPLTKYYRYGYYSSDESYTGNSNNKDKTNALPKVGEVELATYNWFGDLTLGASEKYLYKGKEQDSVGYKGQYSWMQDSLNSWKNSILRGSTVTGERFIKNYGSLPGYLYVSQKGAAGGGHSNSYRSDLETGFRPVLEEIPQNCYDGACFEGEVKGTDFITYDTLRKELRENGKYNIGSDLALGNDSATGGNWLKIFDAREGKTLYIAKKPLTNYVSWNMLYKAGVVYGSDVLNIVEEKGELVGKRNPDKLGEIIGSNEGEIKNLEYKGKIIEIKGKHYIVRLLKAYNEDKNGGDPNKVGNTGYQNITNLKHSEWNRYILPLVKDYRYGSSSGANIEQELKDGGKDGYLGDSHNFKIQLERYNWFGDLTLGTNSDSYIYKGKQGTTVGYQGQWSWMQEYTESIAYRALRGFSGASGGAAYSTSYNSVSRYDNYGFRPVLEEIN